MSNIPESSPAVTPSDSRADPKALLADLRARFPVLAEFRPLKIGIHLDVRAALQGEGIANIRIARALHFHAGHGLYLKALANGGPRYNLAGDVDGEVSEDQQKRAAEQLKERHQAKPPKKRKRKPPPPAPVEPPAPEPQSAQAADVPPARPVLKLKPKAGPVVAASVIRKEAKP